MSYAKTSFHNNTVGNKCSFTDMMESKNKWENMGLQTEEHVRENVDM